MGAPLLGGGPEGLPKCPAQQVGGCVLHHASHSPSLEHFCHPGSWVRVGVGREGERLGWGGSYLIHIQLHLVPHLQALRGHGLMQDEAPTGLRPGHREQYILGRTRPRCHSDCLRSSLHLDAPSLAFASHRNQAEVLDAHLLPCTNKVATV